MMASSVVNPVLPNLRENQCVQTHNSEYYTSVREALDILRGSEHFADIVPQENAMGSANGAGMRVPDHEQLYEDLTVAGPHENRGNFFWIDMLYTPLPHVPIRTAMVEAAQEMYWAAPPFFTHVTVSILLDNTAHTGPLVSI